MTLRIQCDAATYGLAELLTCECRQLYAHIMHSVLSDLNSMDVITSPPHSSGKVVLNPQREREFRNRGQRPFSLSLDRLSHPVKVQYRVHEVRQSGCIHWDSLRELPRYQELQRVHDPIPRHSLACPMTVKIRKHVNTIGRVGPYPIYAHQSSCLQDVRNHSIRYNHEQFPEIRPRHNSKKHMLF